MTDGENEYILGTDEIELERMRFQHTAWLHPAYDLWQRAGVSVGQSVLDLGAGPGFTTFELAGIVGPRGRVVARDVSRRFLGWLDAERERRGVTQVSTSLGVVEEMDLDPESFDVIYGRWVLCWLRDPSLVIECAARLLRPGGVLVLQEYLDWGAMKLLPRRPHHDQAVAACLRSWDESEGEINVGEKLPALALANGLELELVRPIARIGAPGTLEWRWLEEFFLSYLPRLIDRGLFEATSLKQFRAEWEEVSLDRASRILTPTMLDFVARKPHHG